MPEEIFKKENIFTQNDVKNEKVKKGKNEKVKKEDNEKLKKENEQLRKNNVVEEFEIKESIKKPKGIKTLEKDQNTTDDYPNWIGKNKFKDILAIIDSNKLNYRHKTGEFKPNNIKD